MCADARPAPRLLDPNPWNVFKRLPQANTRTFTLILIDEFDPLQFEGALNAPERLRGADEFFSSRLDPLDSSQPHAGQRRKFLLPDAEQSACGPDLNRNDHASQPV